MSTLPATLADAVRAYAHHTQRGFTFVRTDGTERHYPFQEIHAEATRRGAFLRELGLKKGDRVGFVLPEPEEFVLSFLAATNAGMVPVPMYPQLSFKNVDSYHETVGHILKASGARVLLTGKSTYDFVAPVKEKTPTLERIELVESLAGFSGSFEEGVSPSDLAFLQFTSGSTSKPKGVAVTHANLAANAQAIMIDGLQKNSETDKAVSWLPLYHDMGLIGFVVSPMFTEFASVFIPTPSFIRAPRIWLEKIHQHRGTITYAPNFAYGLVVKRIKEGDLAGIDLSCLRVAGCGAEPIHAKTLRDFAAKLAPAGFKPTSFLPSYGMAEATLAISFEILNTGMRTEVVLAESLTQGFAKAASKEDAAIEGKTQEIVNCGRTFPAHEIRIVDESGAAVGERVVGQVIVKGPSVTSGYFQEPELSKDAFKDGWLYTGDLGFMTGEGLFICGRLKDLIIIRGRNYFPSDLEWSVGELPGVKRGNCVAFSVPINGEEQLVICAEAHSSEAATLPDLISKRITDEHALSVYKVELVPQGTLPRTSSGKVQRRKTREMFLTGTLPKRATSTPAA